jgi:hypothetical protein
MNSGLLIETCSWSILHKMQILLQDPEAPYIPCSFCNVFLRHIIYTAVIATWSWGTLHFQHLLQHGPEALYIPCSYCNTVTRHITPLQLLAVIATLSHFLQYFPEAHYIPYSYSNIVLRNTTYPAVFTKLSWGTLHTLQWLQHGPEAHSASDVNLHVIGSQHGSKSGHSSIVPQSQSSPSSTILFPHVRGTRSCNGTQYLIQSSVFSILP